MSVSLDDVFDVVFSPSGALCVHRNTVYLKGGSKNTGTFITGPSIRGLMDLFAEKQIAKITGFFSGGGDSGDLDDITFETSQGQVLPLRLEDEIIEIVKFEDFPCVVRREKVNVKRVIEKILWREAENAPIDWVNNDGGFGHVHIFVYPKDESQSEYEDEEEEYMKVQSEFNQRENEYDEEYDEEYNEEYDEEEPEEKKD